jgi:hypothetical protein
MSDLKQIIMDAKDFSVLPVEIPEWNCTVYIKGLNAGERLRLEKDFAKDAKSDGPAMARTVAYTLCDADGNLLFEYSQKGIDEVQTKNVKVIQRLFHEALKFNAMTQEDVETLRKN